MTIQRNNQKLSPEQPFDEVLELVQPMITSILLKCQIYKDFEYYRHIASIAVWEAWHKADPSKGLFSAYIYTTVKGEILKELSKEKSFENMNTPMDNETINYIRDHEMSERNPVLIECIMSHLKFEERKILLLFYVEGYSYSEIAKELCLSEAAVKKRRTRIMIKLRKLLSSIDE
ncbi:sigma-70 family RNA polymerase sigma factor [Lysinibacillus agricola]|uniref:Sigma-70 family RNA polymerase sigma factor n=1 Tax=Lysinibacillus agricola TaxID=2590012 RepID=A0ABX7AP39_9BACI|nr:MULTISPECIES: sigma-70 family RNA polymerase sigma factor [Lysinibacillus]KOS64816.1 spore protein [Lysinibacillus sp. FJAT-14222]QQP11713.1 sigma-70 family RNA polymerase sigma factor [Lysinibacillus agricola]